MTKLKYNTEKLQELLDSKNSNILLLEKYIPILYFGGQLKFNLLLKRDKAIKLYCNSNNINLIEYSYEQDEIEILNLIKSKLV